MISRCGSLCRRAEGVGGKVYLWNTLRNPTDTHWSTDRWVRGSFSVLQQLEEMALRANVRKCGEIVILFK